MTDKLLNTRQLADFLGVSTFWVKEKRKAGIISFVRLGERLVRFRISDVCEALGIPQAEGDPGGRK